MLKVTTLCLKNVTILSRCKSDVRESILIIFGVNVKWESRQSKGTLFLHLT